uniref:Uncharacterized protein n=1 Tax=Mustela putorius furo TaxID=9669 RepID=M3YVC6_MUSPF
MDFSKLNLIAILRTRNTTLPAPWESSAFPPPPEGDKAHRCCQNIFIKKQGFSMQRSQ